MSVKIVREQAAVAGCQNLGQIRATSLMTGVLASQGYDSLLAQLKSKTAEVSGTHLLLIDFSSGWSSHNAVGDAYRCS
ncbi:hypothetical protein [Microvirga antarctica]|uniref:hypothetical protein n=1 Tax=Microvirga antarctica TaxID=2819233 RepID=UPI001B30089D|nr:hypothetical protein [Microvirga antarctica]